MSASARYAKFITWSEIDQVFVGSCPGLFYGGCHGDDERVVFDELCVIVEEHVKDIVTQGKALPAPTADVDFSSALSQKAS